MGDDGDAPKRIEAMLEDSTAWWADRASRYPGGGVWRPVTCLGGQARKVARCSCGCSRARRSGAGISAPTCCCSSTSSWLVTRRLPLSELNRAFDRMKQGEVKRSVIVYE